MDRDNYNCQEPCHPDSGCPYCAGYWSFMVDNAMWDRKRGQWTDKGWRELVLKQ